jgi:hypothetical protein
MVLSTAIMLFDNFLDFVLFIKRFLDDPPVRTVFPIASADESSIKQPNKQVAEEVNSPRESRTIADSFKAHNSYTDILRVQRLEQLVFWRRFTTDL